MSPGASTVRSSSSLLLPNVHASQSALLPIGAPSAGSTRAASCVAAARSRLVVSSTISPRVTTSGATFVMMPIVSAHSPGCPDPGVQR